MPNMTNDLSHIRQSQERVLEEYYNLYFSLAHTDEDQDLEILANASLADQEWASEQAKQMIQRVKDHFEDREIPTFDLDQAIQEIISDIPRADSDGYDPADMTHWDCGRILNGIAWIGASTTQYKKRIKRMIKSNELGRSQFTDLTVFYPMTRLGELWYRKK
jgi:predicted membrane GTPase involved in stress response